MSPGPRLDPPYCLGLPPAGPQSLRSSSTSWCSVPCGSVPSSLLTRVSAAGSPRHTHPRQNLCPKPPSSDVDRWGHFHQEVPRTVPTGRCTGCCCLQPQLPEAGHPPLQPALVQCLRLGFLICTREWAGSPATKVLKQGGPSSTSGTSQV